MCAFIIQKVFGKFKYFTKNNVCDGYIVRFVEDEGGNYTVRFVEDEDGTKQLDSYMMR